MTQGYVAHIELFIGPNLHTQDRHTRTPGPIRRVQCELKLFEKLLKTILIMEYPFIF